MSMYTSIANNNMILAQEFKKCFPSCKNGVLDQVKYKKWSSQRKCTESEYVQGNDNVLHKGVQISCDKSIVLNWVL